MESDTIMCFVWVTSDFYDWLLVEKESNGTTQTTQKMNQPLPLFLFVVPKQKSQKLPSRLRTFPS